MNTQLIKQWIANDPDTNSQQQLSSLLSIAQNNTAEGKVAIAELNDSFAAELTFGTAGLRGKIGPGPNRMNRAVVIRACFGLVKFIQQKIGNDFSVVIGYDARHGSKQFATDSAAVITALGGKALLFADVVSTPITAFAIRQFNADAAIMVTASHNPAQDNGYKVYLGGNVVTGIGQGAQIVSPHDKEIFAEIKAAPAANKITLASSGWQLLDDSISKKYLTKLTKLVPNANRSLRIVYTPMHGVGGELCLQAFKNAGFNDVHPVTQQFKPDPDFPTVAFPNPEEKGALNLAIELANKIQADLIIANDPDADRCAIAVPTSINGRTVWRQISGDETGYILGYDTAKNAPANSNASLANSIVSSRLLGKIAQAYGLNYQATLTGFKWVARVPNLLFGYEEAIGYCCDPTAVGDKDGISAAIKLAELADKQKQQGSNLLAILDDLAMRFGIYQTAAFSIRVQDLSLIKTTMSKLRSNGISQLAGVAVSESYDMQQGYKELPPTDGMMFFTKQQDRVIVRPSGTEPKIKCYIEVIMPVQGVLANARQLVLQRLSKIECDMREVLES